MGSALDHTTVKKRIGHYDPESQTSLKSQILTSGTGSDVIDFRVRKLFKSPQALKDQRKNRKIIPRYTLITGSLKVRFRPNQNTFWPDRAFFGQMAKRLEKVTI